MVCPFPWWLRSLAGILGVRELLFVSIFAWHFRAHQDLGQFMGEDAIKFITLGEVMFININMEINWNIE